MLPLGAKAQGFVQLPSLTRYSGTTSEAVLLHLRFPAAMLRLLKSFYSSCVGVCGCLRPALVSFFRVLIVRCRDSTTLMTGCFSCVMAAPFVGQSSLTGALTSGSPCPRTLDQCWADLAAKHGSGLHDTLEIFASPCQEGMGALKIELLYLFNDGFRLWTELRCWFGSVGGPLIHEVPLSQRWAGRTRSLCLGWGLRWSEPSCPSTD